MVASIPDAISQVELIYFISETMNTSCENLLRLRHQMNEFKTLIVCPQISYWF